MNLIQIVVNTSSSLHRKHLTLIRSTYERNGFQPKWQEEIRFLILNCNICLNAFLMCESFRAHCEDEQRWNCYYYKI